VTSALKDSFDELEGQIVANMSGPYKMGFGGVSTVGACGLVTVVSKDFYAVANCGDCQAILISEDDSGNLVGENIAPIHSSNLASE
jgi:serine/threonine protein phosphatase PrpC